MALLELPPPAHLVGGFLESTELTGECLAALGRDDIGLLGEGCILDFDPYDASLDLVELGRPRIDFDAQTTGGLIDQVDGLIGEEAIGDVAIRQHRGSHDCAVLDAHTVVDLVALLESTKDANRILHVWLAHEHRLEPASQGRVLLDVLAVLVDRRGTDCAQFAARQHWLEQVGRVDGALGRSGTDDGVEFVDKEHDLALSRRDLAEHSLEPLLELATELRPRQQCTHIECPNLAAAQTLRHVTRDDTHGEAFGDGRLANARLADQHRIVLCSSREDLDDTTDLVVSADHGIDLARFGGRGEIARVLLQRVVEILGVGVGYTLAASDVLEPVQERVLGDVLTAQNVFGCTRMLGECDQDMLGGDVVVAHFLRFLRGALERLAQCQ